MTKPFSLQPILELMQSRTDEATVALARLIASERDAQAKLDLLRQYRGEYAQRFSAAAQDGLTPQAWKNFSDFLARLDDAISQQEQVVAQSQRNTAAGQSHWQQQRVKLKAMDTLSQRHQVRENSLENRREQKLTDEIATRRHFRNDTDKGTDNN